MVLEKQSTSRGDMVLLKEGARTCPNVSNPKRTTMLVGKLPLRQQMFPHPPFPTPAARQIVTIHKAEPGGRSPGGKRAAYRHGAGRPDWR